MNKKITALIIAAVISGASAGGYAVYGANKDKKAENSVNEAKATAAELYTVMEQQIAEGEETGDFKKIDSDKLVDVEARISVARADLEHASKQAERELGGILEEIIEPKLEQMEEYNKGAAIASTLYERINDAEKLAAENPLSPELLSDLPELKEDTIEENNSFKKLKPPFASLFTDRYVEQVEKLEGILNLFVTADQAVQTVIDMSIDESVSKSDFDTKVEEAVKLIGELENDAAISELTSKLEGAKQAYSAAASDRARKAEEEAKTFTAPDGTVFTLGEGKSFEPELSVARKYKAKLYYIPESDVSVFVKDKAIILTMSAGSTLTGVENSAILADLLTVRGYKFTNEEAEQVAKTGKAIEKNEENFSVSKKENQLVAETW